MNTVSENLTQNTTKKKYKVHRSPSAISRKIVAFHELTNLEQRKISAREAASLLEVPNSSMQSWGKQIASQEVPNELLEFFSNPVGSDFLQRIVLAAMKLVKCGSSGIRGMQEFLHDSTLDRFVASSVGALQLFWGRCETAIIDRTYAK